jgi:hypothetical protein
LLGQFYTQYKDMFMPKYHAHGVVVDDDWVRSQTVGLLASRPDLFAKVQGLFWRNGAPYRPGAVFKHLFCIVGGPADEAGHEVACIALRQEDEIAATLAALENAPVAHGGHS